MFFENTTFTNSSTASAPVTIESLRQFMRDFDRKFPKSGRAVKVRMGPQLKKMLTNTIPVHMAPRGIQYDTLDGLPVEIDAKLGYPTYIIEYADETEVIHCGDMAPVRRPINREAIA